MSGDSTPTASDIHRITLGLIIMPSDITTSTHLPLTDGGAPWLWWYHTTILLKTTTHDQAIGTYNDRIMVDTKAMRKASVDQSLYLVVESDREVGSPSASIAGGIRVLVAS